MSRVRPWSLPRVHPLDAQTWEQVDSIILPPPERAHGRNFIDLRRSQWELYKEMRQIPR